MSRCCCILLAAAALGGPLPLSGQDTVAGPPSAPADSVVTLEEYAVYHALVDGHYHPQPGVPLVVQQASSAGSLFMTPLLNGRLAGSLRASPDVDSVTVASYYQRGGERVTFSDKFGFPGTVFLTDSIRATLGDINTFWDTFHARYPASLGLLGLSRIGFNATATQALIEVFMGCGGRCGEGGLFVMEKRNGQWVIAKQLYTIRS
jgi:hypothetical protein